MDEKTAAMLNPITHQKLEYHHEVPVGYSDLNDEITDYRSVFGCYFKDAVLDDTNSMHKIGDMYFTVKFVEKDQELAFRLL